LNNSPLSPLELPSPQSLSESFNIEPLDEEFNSSISYGDTTIRSKADLPDSPTYKSNYKKRTDDINSKSGNKGRMRVLLLMLIGMGFTAWAIVTAYGFMQSNTQSNRQSKDIANQNIQSENVPSQSLVMDSNLARSEIARIEKAPKTDDNINKLISLARNKYENSGSLTESKTILQAIPVNSQVTNKTDQLLQEWQEDTKKNGDLIQKAETAIANGKWQQAIEIVKGVSSTPYWQQRGKKIAANAKQQLDKDKKMVISEPVVPPYVPPVSEAIAPKEPSAPVNEQPYYSAPEPPPREYSAREPVREPVKEVPPAPRDAN
jgi:DNA primase